MNKKDIFVLIYFAFFVLFCNPDFNMSYLKHSCEVLNSVTLFMFVVSIKMFEFLKQYSGI